MRREQFKLTLRFLASRTYRKGPPLKLKVLRRSLLKSVPALAGAIISTNAMAESLFAQTKLTHEASKSQDHPKTGSNAQVASSSWPLRHVR
jgi:hypothetical protein